MRIYGPVAGSVKRVRMLKQFHMCFYLLPAIVAAIMAVMEVEAATVIIGRRNQTTTASTTSSSVILSACMI